MFLAFRRARMSVCSFLLAVATSSADAAITDGLVHYWPLDQVGDNQAPDLVGGNHGLLVNWNAGEPRWVPGKQGEALDFGAESFSDHAVVTSAPIVLDQYTISFFLKARFDPETSNSRIIGPESQHWVLINNEFGKGIGFYHDHGNNKVQDQHPPAIDKWEHYAVTLDRGTGQSTIFRDGFPVATGTAPDYARGTPVGAWVFGHAGDLTDNRDTVMGVLDEIRIYNRILSPDEIIVLSDIATSGDFDRNGVLDASDIDALTRAVRSGQNPAQYDINTDGKVDQEDRRVWVAQRKTTYFGDADLNGEFGTGDLVHAFLRGKYNSASAVDVSWEDGDWNGDGVFDSGDLVAAFQDGGYEMGPRPQAVPVPEPSSLVVLTIGLLGMGQLRRRKRCEAM